MLKPLRISANEQECNIHASKLTFSLMSEIAEEFGILPGTEVTVLITPSKGRAFQYRTKRYGNGIAIPARFRGMLTHCERVRVKVTK